jgi:hypothetical protein
MAKTDKATAGKRASTLATLKRKVAQRDEKYKTYVEMLETAFSNSKSGKSIPKQIDKGEFKKIHKEIKKLEDEIQSNIKRNYAEKNEAYDKYFAESGKPTRNLPPKKQIISTKAELDAMKQPKQYKFPEPPPKAAEPKPSGEEERTVADSKSGFGRKGGKVEPMKEEKASMRGAKGKGRAKGQEEEDMVVGATGGAVEIREENDIKRAREMPEFEVSRIKDLLNYMEQFKPTEHGVMVGKRDELIAANPNYMDYNQEDRDRLALYYTESAFNESFDLQFRNNIIDEMTAAANIEENTKKAAEDVAKARESVSKMLRGEADLDDKPAEGSGSSDPPRMRGGRRRGATDDEPQREGDEDKIKSADSNNKANAEPGAATTGAEKNEEPAAPFTEQPTTTTTAPTTTTVESTDPNTGTKFEGMEGEVEVPFSGGGSGVGAFKGDILSQLEPQSEVASKLAEDKKRRRKDVERLIKEINCFHLVYDDYIPLFRSKEHNKAKDDAIASKDRDKLIKHHLMMSNAIRQYYKTADLRVGVIMSAESMFGQSVSNLITGHMASGGAALPNALGGAKFIPKGSDPVKGAIAGDVTIRRGGRNTKRPITRLVPKAGFSADPTPIPEVTPVVDAPYPYVFQTGVRARRQYRDPQLKLKVKK